MKKKGKNPHKQNLDVLMTLPALTVWTYIWVMKTLSSDFPADRIKESTVSEASSLTAASVLRVDICAIYFQKVARFC